MTEKPAHDLTFRPQYPTRTYFTDQPVRMLGLRVNAFKGTGKYHSPIG